MKIFLKISIIGFLLFGTLSCQKQSVPDIEKDFKTVEEQRRLEFCSEVDLTNNILDHYNVQLLFKCMRWDKEFPSLFQAITKVQKHNWNHLMMPLNDSILKNPKQKERFFRNIRELDSVEGLDDLSFVINALTETNFYDATKDLFECIQDPTQKICESRQGRIPTKSELIKILKFLDVEPKALSYTSNFMKHLIIATGKEGEAFRAEVLKFAKIDKFIDMRLKVVDMVAKKAEQGMTNEDRELLSKILLIGNQDGTAPWIYTWLQNKNLTVDVFLELLRYPFDTNPQLVKDLRGLSFVYNDGLQCGVQTNYNGQLVDFNLVNHIGNYVEVIKTKGQDQFIDFSVRDLATLKLAIPLCKELENNKYDTNFLIFMTKMTKFLSSPEYFDLFKFVVQNTTAKADANKSFSENLYFFDFLSKKVFESINNLNQTIYGIAPDYYGVAFKIVKNLDKQAYLDLGRSGKLLFVPENDEAFKGLALLWNFYSPQEKNFLFNFLDRHYQNNINFVLLYDFYTKLLDDSVEMLPNLRKAWNSDELTREQSYASLEDILSKFNGKDTLQDFKKFFSRDQILKVLEILSSGTQINESAKRDLRYIYADNYINAVKDENYKYDVLVRPSSLSTKDLKELLKCVDSFATTSTFYDLVKNLPSSCLTVEKDYFGIRIYKWLNQFDKTFLLQNPTMDMKKSILDNEGIFSPLMLNTNLAALKILDETSGKLSGQPNGLIYILDKVSFYLYEFKFHEKTLGVDLASASLDWLVAFDNEFKSELDFYRSSIIKEWTSEDNFKRTYPLLVLSNDLLKQYGKWLENGQYLKSKFKSYPNQPDELKCETYLDQLSGPYNCPSKDKVKLHASNVIKTLGTVWDKQYGSPIGGILRSLKNGGGIMVPFESKKPKKYYLTLNEALESVFDLTDKTLSVNQQKVSLVNENWDVVRPTMTTMERIETVIREVRFDYNYLGVAYLNYVVAAEDYNDEVKDRKGLLSKCVKVPGVRCGRKMSDNDLRMAQNSLKVYDGLLDANNGRNLEEKLKYGKFLGAFQQTLVASSSKKAQERNLLPLDSEDLKKHNGTMLADLSLMAAFSNFGRFLRDRIAPNRTALNQFLNRKDVKKVDEALLRGFDLPATTAAAESLMKKLLNKDPKSGKTVVDLAVDWTAGLSYQEQRRVEETFGKLIAIGAYLGSPADVFGETDQTASLEDMNLRYKNNNLFDVFITTEKFFDLWPLIMDAFPKDAKLVDVIREISPFVDFLHAELLKTDSSRNSEAYRLVNEGYIVLREVLFEKREQLNYNFNINSITGVDLLVAAIKKPELLKSAFHMVRQNFSFLSKFQEDRGDERVTKLAEYLAAFLSHPKLDASALRLYFENSSRPVSCFADSGLCEPNYHYDEPMKIVRYLASKNQAGQQRFYEVSETLFKEERNNVDDFLKNILPSVILK